VLGSLFVFFTLVAIRGAVALCAGPNAAAWLGTMLQIVTVVLLVEVLFFLPTVLSSLVGNALHGGASYVMLPPIWFAGLYAAICRRGRGCRGRRSLRGAESLRSGQLNPGASVS